MREGVGGSCYGEGMSEPAMPPYERTFWGKVRQDAAVAFLTWAVRLHRRTVHDLTARAFYAQGWRRP